MTFMWNFHYKFQHLYSQGQSLSFKLKVGENVVNTPQELCYILYMNCRRAWCCSPCWRSVNELTYCLLQCIKCSTHYGVGIVDQISFTYKGEEHHVPWKKYGFDLCFPSASHDNIEGTISILSNDDDCYDFPDGTTLVSAVYNISVRKPLPIPVTVKLQHCVPLDDQNVAKQLSFVTANTEQGRPYKFHLLGDGEFVPGSVHGETQLRHFSLIAIILLKMGIPISLYVGFFLWRNQVHFAATKAFNDHWAVSV